MGLRLGGGTVVEVGSEVLRPSTLPRRLLPLSCQTRTRTVQRPGGERKKEKKKKQQQPAFFPRPGRPNKFWGIFGFSSTHDARNNLEYATKRSESPCLFPRGSQFREDKKKSMNSFLLNPPGGGGGDWQYRGQKSGLGLNFLYSADSKGEREVWETRNGTPRRFFWVLRLERKR